MARAHSRSGGPLRGSLALRVGGTALVIVAAAAVTSVLLLAHSGVQARKDAATPPLSRKVVSALTVGLYNPGPTTPQHPRPVRQMLTQSAGLLTFTAVADPATMRTLERWTADKMSDGSYIYVFAPTGQCLTASASHLSAVSLAKCDLGATQRWRHVSLGFLNNGLYYWELRSQLTGRCLANAGAPLNGQASEHAARLDPCDKSRPDSQLVRMLTAY